MKWLLRLHSDDLGKLILRLSVGGLMLLHGIRKLQTGIDPIKGMLDQKGLPGALAYGVHVGEVLAPALMIIGLWTRPAAAVFAINMIVAVAMVHSAQILTLDPKTGGWMIEIDGLYFFGALALVFLGSGRFSVSRGKGACD